MLFCQYVMSLLSPLTLLVLVTSLQNHLQIITDEAKIISSLNEFTANPPQYPYRACSSEGELVKCPVFEYIHSSAVVEGQVDRDM